MNDSKTVHDLDQQLNKFLQAKCLIPGGLGLWEVYFRQICHAWGRIDDTIHPQHIIFAADNGCNMEGYVGYNYEVTQKQSRNMVLGHTAATHFCDFNNIPYEVVDVGIASDDGIGVDRKVAKGTKNILNHPAMSVEEFDRAFAAGQDRVDYYADQGINLISFGEMGLGNTTTSAAVLSALTGRPVEDTVGPGSWPDKPDLMKRKRDFVQSVLDTHKAVLKKSTCDMHESISADVTSNAQAEALKDLTGHRVARIIATVGGFDIAAITGAMLECTKRRIPFVIDGFISAVAAACGAHMDESIKQFAIPSHHSREKGMEIALNEVGITNHEVPIQAHMAMGEGTGAILMVQMLKTTQHMFVNVGTFAEMMKL